jgi:hypothetical protein
MPGTLVTSHDGHAIMVLSAARCNRGLKKRTNDRERDMIDAGLLIAAVLFIAWTWHQLTNMPSFSSIDEKFRREREQ